MPEPRPKPTPSAVTDNIQSVAGMQQTLEDRRSVVDRLADAIGGFSGSMTFVGIHVVWFGTWILLNSLPLGVRHWDPYPFILLAMIVSVEGVLLSTFVLMKQNRMQRQSDIRAHLDLQVNLLAEKEVTKTLQLLEAIARKLDIDPALLNDAELQEMANVTSVDMLADRVQADLQP